MFKPDPAQGKVFNLDDISFAGFDVLALTLQIHYFPVKRTDLNDEFKCMLTFTSRLGLFAGNIGLKDIHLFRKAAGRADNNRHAVFIGIKGQRLLHFRRFFHNYTRNLRPLKKVSI